MVGRDTDLGERQIVPAIFGYGLGLCCAVASFWLGREAAVFMYNCFGGGRERRLRKKKSKKEKRYKLRRKKTMKSRKKNKVDEKNELKQTFSPVETVSNDSVDGDDIENNNKEVENIE